MEIEQLSKIIVDALINTGDKALVVSGTAGNPSRIDVEAGDNTYAIIIARVGKYRPNNRVFNPQPKPQKRK